MSGKIRLSAGAVVLALSFPAFAQDNADAGTLIVGVRIFNGISPDLVEGWSWIDSLCFSVTIMSTVGLGDFSPATQFGKVFTVFYIFVGVGVFVALFAQFARALVFDPMKARSPDPEDRQP